MKRALSDDLLGALANAQDTAGATKRKWIVDVIRNPNLSGTNAIAQATLSYMPQLSGDEGDCEMGEPPHWLTLTKRQYEALQLWSQNQFDGYSSLEELKAAIDANRPKPIDEMDCAEQPFALTKASLLACVGGAFYPGIEITSICRSKRFYQAAFDVSDTLEPGDVTKWMALPWQADFYECNTYWWPAQRPDAVVSEFDYYEAAKDFPLEAGSVEMLLFPRKQWDRGVGAERTFRPVLEWPVAEPGEDVVHFAAACRAAFVAFAHQQWTFRDRSWRLPDVKDGESTSRYQFRVREYLDHYGSHDHWPFALPDAVGNDHPAHYLDRLITAFAGFIDHLVPDLRPGDTPDSYRHLLDTPGSHWINFAAASGQVGYEVRQNYRGDNEMVHKWKTLGFVTRVPGIPERILVETGRGKYDGLTDRDYFYIMLNWDSYPDFAPKAKELAFTFLEAARSLQTTKQFKNDPDQNIYEFFEYSPSAFTARLQEIYEKLSTQSTQPAEDWTRQQLVSRILQLAPFNQLDGAWLRYATNAGPISEINSALFEVWSDETGNGDPALNHANLYTALMQSVGLYLPDIRSREYADNPAMLDSAYTNPLFELVISQFSEMFFPEILGMTLNLEWEVLSLWPGVKRLEAKGLNSQFYRMHIGIDNAEEGHGARAKQAVQQYLDYVRKESGPKEVAKQWERIWTGYVAFSTTGDISDDFAVQRDYPPTIEDRMISLIERKKYFAQRNHSNLPAFGVLPNRMNDWFEEPQGFLDELANSRYITPGDPSHSYLLNDRTTYSGPMYKIFTTAELALWAEWARWLVKEYRSHAPIVSDPGVLMQQLVERLSSVGANAQPHMIHELVGTLNGVRVKQSVASWFKAGPLLFMTALSDAENGWIIPHSSATSRFFTDLLPNAPAMDEAIKNTQISGLDGLAILTGWIEAGCPLPGGQPVSRVMSLTAPAMLGERRVTTITQLRPESRRRALNRRQIFGQDAVH